MEGDTAERVLIACSKPESARVEQAIADAWISQLHGYKHDRYQAPALTRQPIYRQIWTYKMSPDRLLHYLEFENGRLMRIEIGEKVP